MTPEQQQKLDSLNRQMGMLNAKFDQHVHTGLGMDAKKLSYNNLTNLPVIATPFTYYMGVVTSNVAGSPFPSGWSVSNGATGEYTITHNLGTSVYTVGCAPHSSAFFELTSKGTNSFLLIFWLSQSTTSNTDFDFQVFTTT